MSDAIPDEVIDGCFAAAEEGDVAAVESVLDKFPVLWDDVRFLLGVVGAASEDGQLDVLRIFDAQLRVNPSVVGVTLLQQGLNDATENGQLGVVEYLIQCGADVNCDGVFSKNSTPLYKAIDKGYLEIAGALLNAGAKFRVDDIATNSLIDAINAANVDLVKWLLDHGFDRHVKYRTYDGLICTALSFAPKSSENPVTKLLQDDDGQSQTAAHDEPISDDAAKLYQRTREEAEFRVYFDAIRAGNDQTVREFANRNVFLWERGGFGMDAWDCAARNGHVNVGRAILERSSSVDFPSKPLRRFGIILTAIRHGHIAFAEMMLEKACEFRTHAVQFNPVFVAILSGQHATLEWLLSRELNPHLEYRFTDGRRMNALTYAQELKDAKSIEILRAAGCKPPSKWSLKKQELDEDSDETLLMITPSVRCTLALHDRMPELATALLRQTADLRNDLELMQTLVRFAATTGQASFMREWQEMVCGDQSLMADCLYAATKDGHLDVIRFLIECGVDLNHQDSKRFQSGVMKSAVASGHLDIAQFFYEQGVPLSTATIKENMLFEAMSNDRADIVQWLLTTDLDPHVTYQTKSGIQVNALSSAEGKQDHVVVKMLKDAGCTVPENEAEIVTRCDGLSEEQETSVGEFMEKVVEIYRLGKIWDFRDLHFNYCPDDLRTDWTTIDHHMHLVEGSKKTVVSWLARPFKAPETEYYKTHRFHPEPTVWIEAKLSDGKQEHEADFVCSPSENGSLLACHWTKR